jgi:hypothetical protein
MTQAERLRAVRRNNNYQWATQINWGQKQWIRLGCESAISNKLTILRISQDSNREDFPLVHDPIALHDRIIEVTRDVLSQLTLPGCNFNKLCARLLALSLYGLGSCRFTDIVPGLACAKGGRSADSMAEILEINEGQRIRFFHISKTANELAQWRIMAFPHQLASQVITFYDTHFEHLRSITTDRGDEWVSRVLQNRRGHTPAFDGIEFTRFGYIPDSCKLSPYSFKHLWASVFPSLYYVTNVHARLTNILSIQLGHTSWDCKSVEKYIIF